MLEQFSKFDGRRGANLDEVFGSSAADEATELDDLMRLIEAMNNVSTPPQLEGYYPYRLLVSDRYMYPRKGSLKLTTAHDILFIDELMTDDEDDNPAYVTLPLRNVVATTWIKENDDQADEAEGEGAPTTKLRIPYAA